MSDSRKSLPVFAITGDGYIKMDDLTKQLEIYNDKESARKASSYVVDELSIKEVDIEKYGEMERLEANLESKEQSLADANDQIERQRERYKELERERREWSDLAAHGNLELLASDILLATMDESTPPEQSDETDS